MLFSYKFFSLLQFEFFLEVSALMIDCNDLNCIDVDQIKNTKRESVKRPES